MKTTASSQHSSPSGAKGFALTVTLSLMILLTVIAVGLLSLSSISLRSTSASSAQNVARANAKMALILAIGDLQKAAGADQRITFTSSLSEGTAPVNPAWTGSVNVSQTTANSDPKTESISWLVSGASPDPTKTLSSSPEWNKGDALPLGTFQNPAATTDVQLLAPLVNVTQGTQRGRFAWWIGDEGTKARVDVEKPSAPPATLSERNGLAQSPAKPLLSMMGNEWKDFTSNSTIDSSTLFTIATAALAADSTEIPKIYFNDITTGGYGLPTNVVDSGYKADLSLIFDRSQRTKRFSETYFGVNPPTRENHNGAQIDVFPTDKNSAVVKDPKKFYLSSSLSQDGSVNVGPNWGILWNYATLWQNVSSEQIPIVGAYPPPWSDLRLRDWLPYTNHNAATFQNDLQHTNSSVTPVLSMLQMGFRLKSKLVTPASGGMPAMYQAQMELKPVVGIWNPYNVTIRAAPYTFDWAVYPFIRLNYSRPGGSDSRLTRLWMRRVWGAGATDTIPTDNNQTGGSYFSMRTPTIDIRPGEMRMFSVKNIIPILERSTTAAGTIAEKKRNSVDLVAGWSEAGAFEIDLTTPPTPGNPLGLIPETHRAWVGGIVLQDTYAKGGAKDANGFSDDFDLEFPGYNHEKNASTWVTVKSGNNVLFRSTDFWTGHKDADTPVPEPIISGWKGGAADNTSKTRYPISDILGAKTVPHVATWSFLSRTTTQIQSSGENQRLRGWLDSNPRTLVAMPLWDGSRVVAKKHEGWNFGSQFIGGWHPKAKAGEIGDGKDSPNRGLVSEGDLGEREPQVSDANRFAGFTGPSNTSATGKPNVIVYDVPRSPLVSIGQFQHAQLSRYNFEPGFVIGNSHANPRIPLGAISANNFANKSGLTVADISYEANQRIWDNFFFSTLGNDYQNKTGSSLDTNFKMLELASGAKTLTNPRMQFAPHPGDQSIDKIITNPATATRSPEVIASRILVKGAFNVNSTSKTAWKVFLSSMANSELPVVKQVGTGNWTSLSWKKTEDIRFNRFGRSMAENPYQKGAPGAGDEFWLGWRSLNSQELDDLAEEIVTEVKARGPFRSMAEFVNRNPYASNYAHRLKGGLQAAIDRVTNTGLPSSIGGNSSAPAGTTQFSAAITGENEAAGHAAYLTQGDLLQSLAPIMQVRSDYFRIRACGEAIDATGKVTARAWCEAYVQRSPSYLNPTDPAHLKLEELTSLPNRTFGRQFTIVSFRWLNQDEI